jgi:cytochrome c oxidase subunit II
MSTSPRKRPASEALVAGSVVILLIAIVGVVFATGAGETLFPPQAATIQGEAISELYDIVFAIAVAIFLAVEGLIVWSIVRYRRRPEDVDLPPQTHGNNLVEALWTLIPTVIVLYMFAISWSTLNTVDATSFAKNEKPDVQIHVLAGQFQWQFEYLDANGKHLATETKPVVGTDGEGGMAVPVGKKVYVTLDSGDVIHAFYVPRFLFKRDVVPGQTNHFEFTVNENEAGQVFHGQCAELCGTGHRVMLFNVIAMTQADFDAWLARLVEKANATPPPPPSGAPAIDLAAKNVAFDKLALDVPANAPFVITFKNEDPATVTHDVDIHKDDGSLIQGQEAIPGGQSAQYSYNPLPAGTYKFICSVHPTVPAMNGTLTVK